MSFQPACPRCSDAVPSDLDLCPECGAAVYVASGLYITGQGYVERREPNHHLAGRNGKVLVHRIVAEQMLGRRLRKGEVVHHVNGDRADNRPENLRVFPSNASHLRHHRDLRRAAA